MLTAVVRSLSCEKCARSTILCRQCFVDLPSIQIFHPTRVSFDVEYSLVPFISQMILNSLILKDSAYVRSSGFEGLSIVRQKLVS